MSCRRYTEEFKIEAVKQVTERDHPVTGVAARPHSSQVTGGLLSGSKNHALPI